MFSKIESLNLLEKHSMQSGYIVAALFLACSLLACNKSSSDKDTVPSSPAPSDQSDVEDSDDGETVTQQELDQLFTPLTWDYFGPLGGVLPFATAEQQQSFERGKQVALRRATPSQGLGPTYNVAILCAGCHEKPEPGGSAGLYRNFVIAGDVSNSGRFQPAFSEGFAGGVIRFYSFEQDLARVTHPRPSEFITVETQRNPIPFFGVGLLAELSEEEILSRSDPEDSDGDGISGRPNYDRGFVGRFGRKSQTVSLEGFIRGPLFNHVGLTSNPLSDQQRSLLPVDSSRSAAEDRSLLGIADPTRLSNLLSLQAAAPDGPLTDTDAAADPELSEQDLFDLLSFSMLLSVPQPLDTDADFLAQPDPAAESGRRRFVELGCADCHTPRLNHPDGPIAVYSDLLLHDMGPDLADGVGQGEASGQEFRTQPLWGISAVGPYLHDGRAKTLDEAIRLHAGEAQASSEAYLSLEQTQREELIAFLRRLGGDDQASTGLLRPSELDNLPEVNTYGGPYKTLTQTESQNFLAGRRLFDTDFGLSDGIGAPVYNGDSCRACHFEPVIGGAGPQGLNVVRQGLLEAAGEQVTGVQGAPIVHRLTQTGGLNRPDTFATVFEVRQTPHLFGLGLIESIEESVILAAEDPSDSDGDGISGRAFRLEDGRLGRFGWKAQIPTIKAFVRDALSTEMGLSLPEDPQTGFGFTTDQDGVADPEFAEAQIKLLTDYLSLLAPPPTVAVSPDKQAEVAAGSELFGTVGCESCHTPSLPGLNGEVRAYSNFLLHEILADNAQDNAQGIAEGNASALEFRTAPLWGLRDTAPYWHDGSAETIQAAIIKHYGEGDASRQAYQALSEAQKNQILEFLKTL